MAFQANGKADRSALAQFLIQSQPKCKHKKFSAGEILFKENMAARGCHVIQKGSVELSVVCLDGNCAVVERVGPGGLVGVSAAFVERKYVLTARALCLTETIYIPRHEVIRLFQRHAEMRMLILRSLSQSVLTVGCFVATHRPAKKKSVGIRKTSDNRSLGGRRQ